MVAAKAARKQRVPGRPFKPGESGNPAGKAPGTRNKATALIETLLAGEADAVGRKVVELAKDGDVVALRLCLDRLCPPLRDRPVQFSLPAIETAADLMKASAALLQAVAAGELTPGEAGDVAKLIDAHVRAIEITDVQERLAALETEAGKGSGNKHCVIPTGRES
jgi:Family of unknown function (DUF5681)